MTTNKDSLPSGDVPSVGGDSSVRAGSSREDALPARTTPRTWRIEFPPKQKLLNANQRLHRMAEASIVKQLRTDAFKLARHAKIPRLEHARLDCVYEPPDQRRRDAANWADTAKAFADGVVDAGVLADDDHTRVAGPFMHIGDPFPGGRMVLIITETPAGETAMSDRIDLLQAAQVTTFFPDATDEQVTAFLARFELKERAS